MRVTIFGTGAMAMLFGARLSRAGVGVSIAGRWLECLNTLRQRGVTVEDDGGSWRAPVATVDLGRELPRWSRTADLVLVLVKSHQTERIAPHVARAVAAGGTVVTLQNGLGNVEALTGAGVERVAHGVTSQGATTLAPGRVRDAGAGRTHLPARERRALWLLRAAGLECEGAADLTPRIWLKLAVNCAINPLTACEGVPNGELLGSPALRATMETAAREVAALAEALGIDLPADPVIETARVAFRTAGNRSSMLQDVTRGAPTEIDAITGAAVRSGVRAGVPMPINAELWRRVRALEATFPRGARAQRSP